MVDSEGHFLALWDGEGDVWGEEDHGAGFSGRGEGVDGETGSVGEFAFFEGGFILCGGLRWLRGIRGIRVERLEVKLCDLFEEGSELWCCDWQEESVD